MDAKNYQIPHLQTAQTGPFNELEKHILQQKTKIESWFREIWLHSNPLLTCSVDLRNAGFKISAVDTNLFPAGFNNLNPDFYPLCIQATQNVISRIYPDCERILIIPESHTRNIYYYQSVYVLATILGKAGYDIKVGSLIFTEIKTIILPSSETLVLYPLQKIKNQLLCDDFIPCLILLNNDLSEGIPDLLKDIQQPIDPLPQLGWAFRSKTRHFMHYKEICQHFSKIIEIDAWQISPFFLDCGEIDFIQREGIDDLVEKTKILLEQIQHKYNEYHIQKTPFVMIKADSGTYGMAVMSIRDPQQLHNLNRKQRNSMAFSKGGQSVKHVLIQEGIPTFEKIGLDLAAAEPVVYMLGQYVVGGFYRVNNSRDIDQNLNSKGMHFKKLTFAQCCNNPHQDDNEHSVENQFYVYSVIARLALLASCKEKEDIT